MINSGPPQSGRRLTVAAEKRAELIKTKIEIDRKKEIEHEQKILSNQSNNKPMLNNLRSNVQQQEMLRKQKHGNFIEITGDSAKMKADLMNDETKKRSKENQKRIQESLINRISLYDRHRLEQEKLAAVDKALGIVKDIVTYPTSTSSSSGKENNNNRSNYYKSDSKGINNDRDSDSKGYSNRHDDNSIDSKMLELDPKQLLHETTMEILNSKEKAILGIGRGRESI